MLTPWKESYDQPIWKGLVVGAGGTPKQKQQWRARSSVPQYERRSRPPGRVSDSALSSPERHVWLPDSLNSPGFGFSASPILLRAENRPVLAQTRVSTLSSLSSSPSWSSEPLQRDPRVDVSWAQGYFSKAVTSPSYTGIFRLIAPEWSPEGLVWAFNARAGLMWLWGMNVGRGPQSKGTRSCPSNRTQ